MDVKREWIDHLAQVVKGLKPNGELLAPLLMELEKELISQAGGHYDVPRQLDEAPRPLPLVGDPGWGWAEAEQVYEGLYEAKTPWYPSESKHLVRVEVLGSFWDPRQDQEEYSVAVYLSGPCPGMQAAQRLGELVARYAVERAQASL